MKLNCKQGDLAIIVKSKMGNEGKIVRCLELLVTDHVPDLNGTLWKYMHGTRPIWRVDRAINFGNPHASPADVVQVTYVSDDKLRPLRGDLTDDETETTQEKEKENV